MNQSLRALLRPTTAFIVQKNLYSQSTVLKKSLIHDEESQVFNLKLPEGVAQVTYNRLNGVMELNHTFVPEIFRGKGVAGVLAKEVLDYCVRNNIKVKLTCEYLQSYYKANSGQYKSIVD